MRYKRGGVRDTKGGCSRYTHPRKPNIYAGSRVWKKSKTVQDCPRLSKDRACARLIDNDGPRPLAYKKENRPADTFFL